MVTKHRVAVNKDLMLYPPESYNKDGGSEDVKSISKEPIHG